MSRSTKESLLARWSRLKRGSVAKRDEASAAALSESDAARDGVESGKHSVKAERRSEQRSSNQRSSNKRDSNQQGDDVAPQLPPLEELGPDSDFQAFMDPRVDEDVRRTALKTLFRDPAFNVTDGLDVYAEDYTKLEKLTPAMVAALRYAQRNLFGDGDPSKSDASAAGDGNEGDTGKRVTAAEEPLRSGETGRVTTPATDDGGTSRGASNTGDSDKQAGARAGLDDLDSTPRQQSAEQTGEAGSKDSGTRRG